MKLKRVCQWPVLNKIPLTIWANAVFKNPKMHFLWILKSNLNCKCISFFSFLFI